MMQRERPGSAYDEYRNSVNPFISDVPGIQERSYVGWLAFRDWYQTQGKLLFTSAFMEASGKKIPKPRDSTYAITTAIADTESDYKKKTKRLEYYRIHAFWCLEELDSIIRRTPSDEGYREATTAYAETMSFVGSLIMDSLVLLRECASLLSNSNEPGVHKNPITQLREFYITARYLIYGAFAVGHHSDVSISVIRQALEIKLRRAFGIIAKLDHNENQHPVPLGEIIEVLESFEDKIDFSVPLCSLKRINGWANMYLHTGFKEYAWVAPRVLEYLSDFLLGRPAPGYLVSDKGGVITDENTFHEVRERLKQRYGPTFRLALADQKHCDLVTVSASLS